MCRCVLNVVGGHLNLSPITDHNGGRRPVRTAQIVSISHKRSASIYVSSTIRGSKWGMTGPYTLQWVTRGPTICGPMLRYLRCRSVRDPEVVVNLAHACLVSRLQSTLLTIERVASQRWWKRIRDSESDKTVIASCRSDLDHFSRHLNVRPSLRAYQASPNS